MSDRELQGFTTFKIYYDGDSSLGLNRTNYMWFDSSASNSWEYFYDDVSSGPPMTFEFLVGDRDNLSGSMKTYPLQTKILRINRYQTIATFEGDAYIDHAYHASSNAHIWVSYVDHTSHSHERKVRLAVYAEDTASNLNLIGYSTATIIYGTPDFARGYKINPTYNWYEINDERFIIQVQAGVFSTA